MNTTNMADGDHMTNIGDNISKMLWITQHNFGYIIMFFIYCTYILYFDFYCNFII